MSLESSLHMERAVALFGSPAALATRIGCSKRTVMNMLAGMLVGGEHAVAIEQATDGQVTRHELRPDLFPNPLDERWQGAGRIVVTDAAPGVDVSAVGRVLRIARVEYATGETRVVLSDGSELGGLTQCRVSQYSPDQPADVSLTARIPARKPKEAS
jgi:DNA-binding transcriptional regulator YdaS (Cro superfamily)